MFQKPWCLVPLHIAWHNLVKANVELRKAVLKYEPINIQELKKFFKTIEMTFDNRVSNQKQSEESPLKFLNKFSQFSNSTGSDWFLGHALYNISHEHKYKTLSIFLSIFFIFTCIRLTYNNDEKKNMIEIQNICLYSDFFVPFRKNYEICRNC